MTTRILHGMGIFEQLSIGTIQRSNFLVQSGEILPTLWGRRCEDGYPMITKSFLIELNIKTLRTDF